MQVGELIDRLKCYPAAMPVKLFYADVAADIKAGVPVGWLGGTVSGVSRKQPVAPSWNVADHACRFCLGRVLHRVVKGVSQVRCAQCDARTDGGPSMLCCCGVDCGALGYALECFKNPKVTKEVPHEIMVRERTVENIGNLGGSFR